MYKERVVDPDSGIAAEDPVAVLTVGTEGKAVLEVTEGEPGGRPPLEQHGTFTSLIYQLLQKLEHAIGPLKKALEFGPDQDSAHLGL